MSFAFALILASVFIHATWNFVLKRLGATNAVTALIVPLGVLIHTPVALWQAANGHFRLSAGDMAAMLLAALFELGYFLLLARAYRLGDMSLVYPIARGSGPVFTLFGAVLLLGEQATFGVLVGIVLITSGVLVFSLFARSGGAWPMAAVTAALGTGFFISCYTLWDRVIVTARGVNPLVANWMIMLFLSVFLSPFALRNAGQLRVLWSRNRAALLLAGAFQPLSYSLTLVAMTLAPVSAIAPARELSIVIGALLGVIFLREALTAAKVAGSVLMLAGFAALAFLA